jgi:hypothetical protein
MCTFFANNFKTFANLTDTELLTLITLNRKQSTFLYFSLLRKILLQHVMYCIYGLYFGVLEYLCY